MIKMMGVVKVIEMRKMIKNKIKVKYIKGIKMMKTKWKIRQKKKHKISKFIRHKLILNQEILKNNKQNKFIKITPQTINFDKFIKQMI